MAGGTSRSWLLPGWMALGTALVVGCGGAEAGDRPVSALTLNILHEHRFEALERRFASGTRDERLALEPELVAFAEAHPSRSILRALDVMRAWIFLDKGELDEAERLAREVAMGPPGTTQNVAEVVLGAVLRRRGDPHRALEELEPLVNKIIDSHVRDLLNEEVVEAALEARMYGRALSYMDAWLRDAEPEERARITTRIQRGMVEIPAPPLVVFLTERTEDDESATDRAVAELAATRLAAIAKSSGDVTLARRLLSDWRYLLGEEGDSVAQLAVGQMVARVSTRTVGLLLSLGDDERQRRGVEVATGLAFGLGGAESELAFVSRDDAGSDARAAAAITELSALGAAVIVAGIDEPSASLVAKVAERERVPVLLLRPPHEPSASPFVFVLGEDPREVASLLSRQLTDAGVSRVAVVGEGAAPCQSPPSVPPAGRDGARARPSEGRMGLLVLSGPTCLADAERVVGAGLLTGLGLDAAAAADPGDWFAASGVYPIDASQPPASVAGLTERLGRPPTWWEGLGRDAGALARSALETLPAEVVVDAAAVAERRQIVVQRLAGAEANLWTSGATSFAGAHVLERAIEVRRAP